MFYRGNLFPDWRGDALAAGLSAKAIVRIEFEGVRAREAGRYDMGVRIRTVVEGPDGALWVLEDGRSGGTGRLLKLTPND
jgi:glucose/arabinose dehydrogenase